MHRTVPCLRTCRYSRPGRFLHAKDSRFLSNAGAGYQLDDDGNVVENVTSWEEYHAREVGRRPADTQNIVIDDLSATLEAHRAHNRASVIRKLDATSDKPQLFLRPSVDRHDEGEGGAGERLTEGSTFDQDGMKSGLDGERIERAESDNIAGAKIWPADSVQAQAGYSMQGRRGLRSSRRIDYAQSTDILEYTGVPFPPRGSWSFEASSTPLLTRPWMAYMEQSSKDNLERLSCEIRAYEAYMRLTPAEEAAAQMIMSDVKSVTQRSLQKAPLKTLGSRSTGLATPISDFDLSFSVGATRHGSNEAEQRATSPGLIRKAVSSLRQVERDLRSSTKLRDTVLVLARIPIIETRHCTTGLRIQIQTMAGYQSALEYSAAYLKELPSLRPLFIVLRYCLEIRGLTTVYEGGLGSYSLLMMIVNALKHASGSFASDDLAGQLLYVLYFYGSADLYNHGFSVNPPRVFDKLKGKWSISERVTRSKDPQLVGIDEMVCKRNYRKPYLLCLQDPANYLNDLGKNSYAIKHIQAVFNKAHQSILSALEHESAQPKDHRNGGRSSYLTPLVKADYEAFEANRSKVERFAKGPTSKDYDYSTDRVTEDFRKRVQIYKGLIKPDLDPDVIRTKQRPNRLEPAGSRIRSSCAGSESNEDKPSLLYLDRVVRGSSATTIRNLRREWYGIKERLARISGSCEQLPSIRKDSHGGIDQHIHQGHSVRILHDVKGKSSQAPVPTANLPFIRKEYSYGNGIEHHVYQKLTAHNLSLWAEWHEIKSKLSQALVSAATLPFIRKGYSNANGTEHHVHQQLAARNLSLWAEWHEIKRALTEVSTSTKNLLTFRKHSTSYIEQHVHQDLPRWDRYLWAKWFEIRRQLGKAAGLAATMSSQRSERANETHPLERQFLALRNKTDHLQGENNAIIVQIALSNGTPLTTRLARKRYVQYIKTLQGSKVGGSVLLSQLSHQRLKNNIVKSEEAKNRRKKLIHGSVRVGAALKKIRRTNRKRIEAPRSENPKITKVDPGARSAERWLESHFLDSSNWKWD